MVSSSKRSNALALVPFLGGVAGRGGPAVGPSGPRAVAPRRAAFRRAIPPPGVSAQRKGSFQFQSMIR